MGVKATVKKRELKDGKLFVTMELDDGRTMLVAFDANAPIQDGQILEIKGTVTEAASATSSSQLPVSMGCKLKN